ncbi:MAG: RNase adapter RapZ [Thermodesulfobacteriota bacterium]
MTERAFPVIILTGLSGSGKSSGLKVFEDLGFFCVDGLPVSLAPILIRLFEGQADTRYRGLALGMDVRQEDLDREWGKALGQIKSRGVGIQIVFIEADTREIIRRYATTRRPHPLEKQDVGLERAVVLERDRMSPIREAADLIINTTNYSIHDLRRTLQEKWSFLEGKGGHLKVHVMSFGFKYGPPAEADLIFDLRFLPNPYFVETLRPLSGKDPEIREYVLGGEPGKTFLSRLEDFLLYLLPLYVREGRYRLALAMGCTGGRHRSVAVAEAVFDRLIKAGYILSIEHRHIDKE